MIFFVNMCVILFCFFFFKQKTAYEMRISDWSSDVCSSDLYDDEAEHEGADITELRHDDAGGARKSAIGDEERHLHEVGLGMRQMEHRLELRSEEHTSELQSLMRISYAVFFLKKKRRKEHIDQSTRAWNT